MASFLIPTAAITLLFILTSTPSVAAFVTDKDGNLVINGGEYYILPHGSSGGLSVAGSTTSEACPLFISTQKNSNGSPVNINSPLRIRYIPTSSPVIYLSFDKVTTTCNKDMHWWISPSDDNGNSYVLVGTDGPFESTYAFKIEEAKSGNKNEYNIKFCHRMESQIFRVSQEDCKDVTILEDGALGVKYNAPLAVTFVKATSMSASYY